MLRLLRKAREVVTIVFSVSLRKVLGPMLEIQVVDHGHLRHTRAGTQETIRTEEEVCLQALELVRNASLEVELVEQRMPCRGVDHFSFDVRSIDESFVKGAVEQESEPPIGKVLCETGEHFVGEPSNAVQFVRQE